MAAVSNTAKHDAVSAEIRARTAELAANVERAKAAACSIASPKPIERDLIELLKETTDPQVLRQVHVALEAMKNVWDLAKRVEAKGVPWIVVARSGLLDLAKGFLAARERGERLSPDQAWAYSTVTKLLRDTEPAWEAFCRFERMKQRRAEPRKTARGQQAKGLWEDRIEKLMAVWAQVQPIHGKTGWQQKAIDLYVRAHGEKLSPRTLERVVTIAQARGLVRKLRRRAR